MDFLFELYCEELPASYLDKAIDTIPEQLTKKLTDLRAAPESVRATGTPRRIVVHAAGLPREQRASSEELTGPPVSAAFKDGQPTKAALSFAQKVGVPVEKLEQRDTPKGKYLFGTKKGESRPTAAVLPAVLAELTASIEFPKGMVWVPGSKLRFARPLRSIVALLDDEVVALEWNGIRSGRATWGHPFLAPGTIELRNASFEAYEAALEKRNVIVDRDRRRRMVAAKVQEHMKWGSPNPRVVETAANLVEWPEVMTGEFEKRFLEITSSVVVAAIEGHLRAFPIFASERVLESRFAFVCNRPGNDTIRAGNERVLRARLSDAHFFYWKDQKTKLVEFIPRLEERTYQQQLGTYADKESRVEQLALHVAASVPWPDTEHFKQAARILYTDLFTEVVGEFPELQGEIGSEYAARQGQPAEVAEAIREAYWPRGEGGALPATRTGIALSLAEKLDNAVSAFGTGMKPTGSKDPLGVRRQIIGILRILRERAVALPLRAAIEKAASLLPEAVVLGKKKPDPKAPPPDLGAIRAKLVEEVREYAKGRLVDMARKEDYRLDLVNAVLAAGWEDVPDFWARLGALSELAKSARFFDLVKLVERTRNITKDSPKGKEPEERLLQQDAEKELFKAYTGARGAVEKALGARHYAEAGKLYEQALASPVERIMKDVFVNDKDDSVRQNRHALLERVHALLAKPFADLAEVSASS
ncbi:MAG TPA: glycine--tRNA ligase subunit beta [Planctomycetota bacterium]|nr:glycine--tRNA ligase subunit beta [Planctomycetota bacterium]